MATEQTEIPGTEQAKIAAIERAADKYREKTSVYKGIADEVKTLGFKVREAVHANEDQVSHEEDKDGNAVLRYVHGDYDISVTAGKEKLKVVIDEQELPG